MNFNFIELIDPKFEILNYKLGYNTFFQYIVALGVFLLSIFILIIFQKIIVHKLKKMAKKTAVEIDDLLMAMISALGWPFYAFWSFYIALRFISVPQVFSKYLPIIIFILTIYYIVKIIQVLIDYWTHKLVADKEDALEIDASSAKFFRRILKGILWIIAIILVLQNLGYNISTLAAGLGIGGIAIAFALQNILVDIFASFSIHFDRPFQVGDFIVIGEEGGDSKKHWHKIHST